jgi:hypothetical protein
MDIDLQKKITKDIEKGNKSEELFITLMEKKGYSCYRATKSQDYKEHWDVCVVKDFNGKQIFERIDIKGLKDGHSLGYTWIELQNVRGEIGWIYSEALNTIAFEKQDCFEFIDRKKLLKYIEKKMVEADIEDGEHIVYCSKEGLGYYRAYRRAGRDDRVIKVPWEDIQHLVVRKLMKSC